MTLLDRSLNTYQLNFHDLFDLEAIQKIQDAFAVATGVASIITDTNGVPITQPSNFCDLCQNVIRKTEKGLANCFKSDAILGQVNVDGPTVQPCLSGGLLDGGTSIMAGDRHVANWLIGQVLDESCDIETMKAYAKEIGADEELYLQNLDKVTRMPREKFDQISQMLFVMANQLSQQALLNAQLAESEDRFKHMVKDAPLGIAIVDSLNAKFYLVNPALARITGRSMEELERIDWETITHPDDIQPDQELMAAMNAGSIPGFQLEKRYLHQGGYYFWVNITVAPMAVADRSKPRHLLMVEDITERKQAEGALLENEERFKALHNASFGGIAIHDRGVILDCNQGLSEISGFDHDELIGMDGLLLIAEQSRETVMNNIRSGYENPYEAFGLRKSGEEYHLRLEARNIPYQGKMVRVVEFRDITVRKRMEKALRASEGHYRSLVNTIPHGITVLDREHRIVEINDSHARMFGHPREWFIGRHCYDVFEKRDHICPHCPGVVSMQTGEVAHTETEGVHDDGTRFPVMLHTAPFQLDDGSVGFIEVVEDITEKRKFEALAINSARMASLGEMATGVAHEINNPITGVINCAQLLKDRLPADSNCLDIVERISREGTRIAKIVKSLLMITHPGHHRLEKVWLRESLETVLTLSHAKLVGSGIQLHTDLPPDLPPIAGEPQMIEQLLLNLINNAHYALNERYPEHHEAKQLTVSATLKSAPTGGRVCLAVHDQGAGVRTEHLGKLFDPFFTTKPAGVGTGLGLGLCYEIVKRHNGEIRVESDFGHFTRVTVELPVLP